MGDAPWQSQVVLWTPEMRRHLRLQVVYWRSGQPVDWQASCWQQEKFRVKLGLEVTWAGR